MKYYTKSVQYYRYFEDAKLIEIDDDNKKMAIVLNGKEEIIDIFDGGPYIDYNPNENLMKEFKFPQYEENESPKYGELQIIEECNHLDANKIFNEIKNYKNELKNNVKDNNHNNINQIKLNKNSNIQISLTNKTALVEGKNFYIHHNLENQKNKDNTSNLSRLMAIYDENNRGKKELEKKENKIKMYTILSKSKFQIYYLSPYIKYKNKKINPKKPKIKHKLLSVINLNNDSVLGIKWFCFNNLDNNNKDLKNLSEIKKYILKSKLLLVVGQEGLISIYKLIDYQPFNHIRVNLAINALQSQPFSNYRERYSLSSSLKVYNPIIDYNLLDRSFLEEKQGKIRLITLHINNTFTFWSLLSIDNQIKLNIDYTFQLTNFICENFLMDSNEDYLICFNKKGIMILLSKNQYFPYPIVYRYNYNENVPSLKELKNIIDSNDLLIDEDNINKKKYDKNIITHKGFAKEKMNGNKKYVKKGKKKELKNKKPKKEKKEENILFKKRDEDIKKESEEEDENEIEEEKLEYFDEFIIDENPGFINDDEEIFLEDDKFLKLLQKPCFLCCETKFLFVNFEIKTNQYFLYCFNFRELYKVEYDLHFLEICLNELVDNLITKIYSSKEKIYFSGSPFYYFHPIRDESIDNNLLNNIQNRKILREKEYQFNSIMTNLYEGLFIREGDNIIIIKINIKNETDLEIINNDIILSKFTFYQQPTSENLKSNFLAKWTINNTLIINSIDSLFNIIKFSKENIVLGIPISKKKAFNFLKLNYK